MSTAAPPLLTRRARGGEPDAREHARRRAWGPWLLVAAAVVWNLVVLRAETWRVTYLDDSSVHVQMVRFAAAQFGLGHSPLTSWFPYLGLGSPQFLHYQSLPAMLAGALGTVTGPGAAFRWTLYLLVSLWPVSIYLSARLFGIDRWGAAGSAVLSPFIRGITGVGYEQGAYLWIGYGVWTQLWASVTLPLAWGFSWRAIRDGRGFFPAGAATALTIALHFETGYLAILPLLVWPFAVLRSLPTRIARAAVIAGGALLAATWVIVPLLVERRWAATNQVLHGTPLVNGYGAPKVLGWLLTGKVLDAGRLPVITVLAAIGLALAIRRWRTSEPCRGIVVALGVCLLLSFGRTTFGALVDVIPGHADLFFRRFMMGVQLAGLLLAGVGAEWCGRHVWLALNAAWSRWGSRAGRTLRPGLVPGLLLAAAAVLVLVPAWSQSIAFNQRNTRAISSQISAEASDGLQVDRLLRLVRERGGGRVYAGMPSNWGTDFTVGAVPVFKFLEARDVDEVGYTLRTASLMTDPEYYFDDRNLSNYILFGIRYLIVPRGTRAPVPSVPLACAGYYCLREIAGGGYVHVGRLVGTVGVTRSDVATRSLPVLRSRMALAGDYVRVLIGENRPLRLHARGGPRPGLVLSQGRVVSQGAMTATVAMRAAGITVLSASFDPGWSATVDGRHAKVFAVAPALVATRLAPGRHTVTFRYHGFSDYPLLFTVSALSLLALGLVDLVRRRRRAAPRRP